MTEAAPKFKFYVFVDGRKAGADPSVEVPFMMLDGVDYNNSYVVGINQEDQSQVEIRNRDELEAFQEAAARNLVWGGSKAEPVFQYWRGTLHKEQTATVRVASIETLAVDFEKYWVFLEKDGVHIEDFHDYESMRHHLEHRGIIKTLEQTAEVVAEPVDKINKAVDPGHYKGYVGEMQWLDAMSQIPSLRAPERFIAAVELQIRKYMDRNGAKDNTLQEWKKARFYMCYLIAYIENGHVHVPAAEIHNRMKGL